MSRMWEAFIKQQKTNPKEADTLADLRTQAIKEFSSQREKEAINQLAEDSKSIFEIMNLDSNITQNQIQQKTKTHPKMANYDHSLEKTRIKFESPEHDPDKPMLIENVQEPKEKPLFAIDWDSLAASLN